MINYTSHGKLALALLKFKLKLNTELLSLKSTVYNQSCEYALSLISNMNGVALKIVEALPDDNISDKIIYLLKDQSSSGEETKYFQYLMVDGDWEMIGSTAVNLKDYLTISSFTESIANYVSKDGIQEILGGYVSTSLLETLLLDYVTSGNLTETVNESITTRMEDYVKTTTFDGMMLDVVKSSEMDAYITTLVNNLKAEFVTIGQLNEKFNESLTISKIKKGTGISLITDDNGNLTIGVNVDELDLSGSSGNIWVGTKVEFDSLEEDPNTSGKTYLIIGNGADEPTFTEQLSSIQDQISSINTEQSKIKSAITRLAEESNILEEINTILK